MGHTFSCGGSASTCRYYPLLVPYVHYIPVTVEPDGTTDLLAQIDWAERRPDKVTAGSLCLLPMFQRVPDMTVHTPLSYERPGVPRSKSSDPFS